MTGTMRVVESRLPAVAGLFYPRDPRALRSVLRDCLARPAQPQPAAAPPGHDARLKALICPHAGYEYSGPIAGSAFRALDGAAQGIHRVILVGPSHFVAFSGLAVPRVEAFETPLGAVPVDTDARRTALGVPHVVAADAPHAREHSLEVQLPFLQVVLGEFTVLPIAAGDATAPEAAAALERLWGGEDTLIVVSSDLSHYLTYAAARRADATTAEAILNYSTGLDGQQACGCVGINGLMHAAQRHRLRVRLLDLRNSGDTSAERSRVVGYGAFALYDTDADGSGTFAGSR